MSQALPFPVNPTLSAIALMYKNPDIALIADAVLPRTPTSRKSKYLKYDLAQGYTAPDTKVGRKSAPNQIDFTATEVTFEVDNYALDDLVPNEDIVSDNQGVDPLGTATTYLTNLMNLSREIRVANMVFNTTNYSTSQTTTLAGTSQWSDTNSDPVKTISDMLDNAIIRPNICVLGQKTWTALRRHPKLVQSVKNTAQNSGIINRAEFAELFEIQELLVGAGFVNTAKRGQAQSMSRVWGNHAAFIYRDRAAGPQAGVTFGFTAQFEKRFAGNIPEPKIGISGGQLVRVGERLKEVICAPELGVFFQNAVAA